MVSRAFHVAMSGRPGPVVLALPEDMLVEQTVNNPPQLPVAHPARATVTAGDATTLLDALETSTNPMIVVGGGAWSNLARLDLQDFATKWSVPVAASFRCQDFFDNAHPLYAGGAGIGINPKLAARIKSADVVILLGTRFSEMKSSGYSLINIPKPAQHLIHIYPDLMRLVGFMCPIWVSPHRHWKRSLTCWSILRPSIPPQIGRRMLKNATWISARGRPCQRGAANWRWPRLCSS
ncbi:hypothetical protein [Phaeobacter piscinae]|uniref:hypothetical protein n=1 Tax=Phaeobacter piscinae TaxID=1580596 RepID=UPI0013F48664|nr:hypothetical protein [Phaeobacter piscinae]UTS82615.1 3D-(3,5/4)-trihydroxycyclohexane-1,2-dione hydrolase [Phaeobacter piscinae]